MATSTDPTWPELLGSTDWANLLEPLPLSLRTLILRCGDHVQATYDAFNSDPHSKYCGSSRYSSAALFRRTLFPYSQDYDVSSFLYATSAIDLPGSFLLFSLSREAWSKESNWVGYVAVSSDNAARVSGRREIVVAWRGTIRDIEWIDVLKPELVELDGILDNGDNEDHGDEPKVMKGWYTIYMSSDSKSPFSKYSAREQLLATVEKLVNKYQKENLSIICTGHSLGASLGVLSAFDLVQHFKFTFPVCAVVFGCPQVGNKAFKKRISSFPNLKILHVKQKIDLIPLYPSGLLGYSFIGTELVVDGRKSQYLKDSKTPGDWHNLQGILHIVAGWNGDDGEFKLQVKRSVALVNKSSEYLKDECLVPGSWWVEKNKGMVLGEDGEWRLEQPEQGDIPVPPILDGGDDGLDVQLPTSKKGRSPYHAIVSCFGADS